jgi:hypothetical protein
MHKPDLLAATLTALFILGLIGYRLLWMASGTASAAALGRFPLLPKHRRRWLFGEPTKRTAYPLRTPFFTGS